MHGNMNIKYKIVIDNNHHFIRMNLNIHLS